MSDPKAKAHAWLQTHRTSPAELTKATSHRPSVPHVALSHERLRVEMGATPSLPDADESGPVRDPKTGRFVKGNRAWRRRQAKRTALAVLSPRTAPVWLRPHVDDGSRYHLQLQARFPDPALSRLVADAAAAHVVSTALLSLGASGDAKALSEARSWLREHRATIRELSALASLATHASAPTDPWAHVMAVAAAAAKEADDE